MQSVLLHAERNARRLRSPIHVDQVSIKKFTEVHLLNLDGFIKEDNLSGSTSLFINHEIANRTKLGRLFRMNKIGSSGKTIRNHTGT